MALYLRQLCAQFRNIHVQTSSKLLKNVVDANAEKNERNEIVKKVNDLVANNAHGRLFAVVHLAGKQFKVTDGDVIIIEGYWPPDVGDKITLDKVMLAGSADFSLIGRPILEKGLVNVQATVIEKTMSHTKTHFRKKRRKQYMRTHFYRVPQTFLRINEVSIQDEVDNPKEVRGLETAVF
ncbi:unnamed protein product [Phyllotreta striolata]|uniref:Large ribosomal subunit protein bL21m n=1 Tax=Phyllotreta striolata TaxID=444603 RepID=A0A9N9TY66_PHYSR|nr:unnamed protein product [Phyllotreta striolata]